MIRLDRAAADVVIDRLASAMKVSPSEAAEGVARVATVVMARAIKVISVERGRDPRELTLVAFGGAGGMFACDVADELGMERVLVPPAPGLLCAYGALVADVARDLVATHVALVGSSLLASALLAEAAPLIARAHAELEGEGIAPIDRRIHAAVDLRYRGQSYELAIDLDKPVDVVASFHAAHHARFGFSDPARPVERVAIRVHARGEVGAPPPLVIAPVEGDAQISTGVYTRARLAIGAVVDGPALVVELSATTVIATGWRGTVDGDGALHLARR